MFLALLTILRAQETRVWHDIVILDESWFYYMIDHQVIELPRDGKVPDRVLVGSARVRSSDRPREWVQIQRELSCEQFAHTIV
jgi:hypothetical protein